MYKELVTSEMSEIEIKLECLKLAIELTRDDPGHILVNAKAFFNFLTDQEELKSKKK